MATFLTAGQVAPQEMILKGFRLGATRLGGWYPTVNITIDGTTRTTAAQVSSLNITEYEGGVPNTARLRVSGFVPSYGHEIKIGVHTVSVTRHLLFAGHILGIDQVTEAGDAGNVAYDLTCVDYTWLLNWKKVSKQYLSQSATTILQDIIDTFTSGFTYVNVEAGLTTIDEITFTNVDVSDAIQRVMKRIGGYWKIDYGKDLHAFLTVGTSANSVTDAAPHTSEVDSFRVTRDLSQVRTRYFGEGLGSMVSADTDVGATSIPVDDATVFNAAGGLAKAGHQNLTYTGKATAYTHSSIWTSRAAAEANTWTAMCWSPELGLFVAVANSGTYRVMTSPDGITWTGRTAAEANDWRDVCWSADLTLFVAVAITGTYRVMTSPDGITWTGRTAAAAERWSGICWSSDLTRFVSVAQFNGSSDIVMTSPNGVDWTIQTAASDSTWLKVCWSEDLTLFVAVASNPAIMTSPDGVTWTTRSNPASAGNWWDVCWSAELGRFVAVAPAGTVRLMTSTNGTAWTGVSVDASEWRTVRWAAELGAFVAVGSSGNDRIMISTDGLNWSLDHQSATSTWYAVAWAPTLKLLAVVGNVGTFQVMTSSASAQASLSGVPASGAGAITKALIPGDEINLVVQRDDAGRQAALAALTGGDGIIEDWIQDRRLSEAEMIARCDAALELNGDPAVSVMWDTRDRSVQAAKLITFDLTPPALDETDLKIQRVTLSSFGVNPRVWPWRRGEASSTRESFEALVRQFRG